jgi:hypothetical protein
MINQMTWSFGSFVKPVVIGPLVRQEVSVCEESGKRKEK